MKLKFRKSAYYFIPLGLIIKVALTILILNLPGGCKEERDNRMREKAGMAVKTVPITANYTVK